MYPFLTREQYDSIKNDMPTTDIDTVHKVVVEEFYHSRSEDYTPLSITFKSDHGGEQVDLPVSYLSRYFDYFSTMLRWKRESVVSVPISEKALLVMKQLCIGYVALVDVEEAFSFFMANDRAYLHVIFPVGYNDEEMMKSVGDILIQNIELSIGNGDSIFYFVIWQTVRHNDTFLLEYWYKHEKDDIFERYLNKLVGRDMIMDEIWCKRFIEDYDDKQLEELVHKQKYKDVIIKSLVEYFKGDLKEDDYWILDLLKRIERRFGILLETEVFSTYSSIVSVIPLYISHYENFQYLDEIRCVVKKLISGVQNNDFNEQKKEKVIKFYRSVDELLDTVVKRKELSEMLISKLIGRQVAKRD